MTFTLRDYQHDMLDAIHREIGKGTRRILIRSATGTGKTVTFAHLLKHGGIASFLSQFPENERRMLIIAHREELLDQAAAKMVACNPNLVVTVEQGDRVASRYSDVVVASIQTLIAKDGARLDRLMRDMRFRIVVVDECHHAAAKSYREVLHRLGFLPSPDSNTGSVDMSDQAIIAAAETRLAEWDAVAPKDRVLIGFTATPNRSDAVGLSVVFQTIAFSYGMKDAVEDGHLVPIRAFAVETDTSLDNVKTTAGEFNQRDLAETVNTPQRNVAAFGAWREHAEGRASLVFTVDVQHAHDAAGVWQKAGYRFEAISGETPKEQRRALLRDFQSGAIDGLCNAMLLTEGTDLPRASCLVHLKPTKSATLYEQMTGRGLRLYDGKTDCVVIDMVDIARKHTLQAAPMLYGLPPELAAQGKELKEVERELAALRDEFPTVDIAELIAGLTTLDGLRAQLAELKVWDVQPLPEGIVASTRLDWLRLGGALRISYPWRDGNETLEVTQDILGHWDAVRTFRSRDAGTVDQGTILTGVHSMEEAAMRAEQFITDQRATVVSMKARDAGWKGKPASPKQLAFLRRLKVPFGPNLSSGEASRLIDIAKSRK